MVKERFISSGLKFREKLAQAAIAVSFFVIIVAVAVSAGFRNEVRGAIAANLGDIRVAPYQDVSGEPVPLSLSIVDTLSAVDGIKEIRPVAKRGGIVKSGDVISGVVVKGVPSGYGSLEAGIPKKLSAITGLGVGDALTVYFPGEKLKVRKFTICRVFPDPFEMDRSPLVYVSLGDMQRLNQWTAGQAGELEINVLYPGAEAGIASALGNEPLTVTSTRASYTTLFDWLRLLDSNVAIILILMAIVAGFNMVSGLLIMLLRNISAIGILKTMGMKDADISRVFLYSGARAALRGLLIGNAAALLFCLVQGAFHIIPLNPDNYFIGYVPVYVPVVKIILADIAAFALVLALLWLPSRLVSRIDPAVTVKAD